MGQHVLAEYPLSIFALPDALLHFLDRGPAYGVSLNLRYELFGRIGNCRTVKLALRGVICGQTPDFGSIFFCLFLYESGVFCPVRVVWCGPQPW